MRKMIMILLFVFGLFFVDAKAQSPKQNPTVDDEAKAEQAFKAANALMEQKKYSEALTKYKESLSYMPDDPSILYNGGLAAYMSKDFKTSIEFWQKLKTIDTEDWQVRSKLIQAYQAAEDFKGRDDERKALFDLRKSGKITELNGRDFYCREQTEIAGRKVFVFEHFELKGDRALRYAFEVVDEKGEDIEYTISLGSYNRTNSIWRETKNPKPKEDERLFHLDGYYKWGHATFGFYTPEPTYDQIRKIVVGIIEKKNKPISSTTIVKPEPEKQEQPPKKP